MAIRVHIDINADLQSLQEINFIPARILEILRKANCNRPEHVDSYRA